MTGLGRIAEVKSRLLNLWRALWQRAGRERLLAGATQPKPLARPPGRLIWLHLSHAQELATFSELITDLLDGRPDLHLLVSVGGGPDVASASLPARVFRQPVPAASKAQIRSFVAHWRPDLMIWSDSDIRFPIVELLSQAKVPMLLINAKPPAPKLRPLRWLGAHNGRDLARFDRILLQDDADLPKLARLGIAEEKIEVIGNLQGAVGALRIDEMQLQPLLGRFKGKQVWLVAGLHPAELETVIAAHLLARRSAPGLILILVTPHENSSASVAAGLRADGWAVASHDDGEVPGSGAEIYIVTGWAELGLWYRLAAICYVGGTIEGGDTRNPFEAAHFGCAILHGDRTGQFADSYARLSRANAAVLVPNAQALGPALVECLPAGRAAELATNAWSVSSENADVVARLHGIIDEYLDQSA